MKSLKAGAALLSIWCGLNLVVAVIVTGMTLAGQNSPALELLLSDEEIARVDEKVIAVVNAQASLANPCIAALCVVALVIVWKALMVRARWAFWALSGTLVPLQAFGFVSDGFLGHRNLIANALSTAVLLAGLALALAGLNPPPPAPPGSTV